MPELSDPPQRDATMMLRGLAVSLQGLQAEVNTKLDELTLKSSAPATELLFTAGLLARPVLSLAISAVETAIPFVASPREKQSAAERALAQLRMASYRREFRQLDVRHRIVPQIQKQATSLTAEHQRLGTELTDLIDSGAIKQMSTPDGQSILVSRFNSEEMNAIVAAKFDRLGTLNEVLSTDRVSESIRNLTERSQRNAAYAKKRAYSRGIPVTAVVLAEQDGEQKAHQFFIENTLQG